jgi:hypothetical protein
VPWRKTDGDGVVPWGAHTSGGGAARRRTASQTNKQPVQNTKYTRIHADEHKNHESSLHGAQPRVQFMFMYWKCGAKR